MEEQQNKDRNHTYYAIERQSRILDYINEAKRVSVNDLADYFQVSHSTIRNDLAVLKKNGQIQMAVQWPYLS